LVNINPNKGRGRYPTVSIPTEFFPMFKGDYVIVSELENGLGMIVLPAEVKPVFGEDQKEYD